LINRRSAADGIFDNPRIGSERSVVRTANGRRPDDDGDRGAERDGSELGERGGDAVPVAVAANGTVLNGSGLNTLRTYDRPWLPLVVVARIIGLVRHYSFSALF